MLLLCQLLPNQHHSIQSLYIPTLFSLQNPFFTICVIHLASAGIQSTKAETSTARLSNSIDANNENYTGFVVVQSEINTHVRRHSYARGKASSGGSRAKGTESKKLNKTVGQKKEPNQFRFFFCAVASLCVVRFFISKKAPIMENVKSTTWPPKHCVCLNVQFQENSHFSLLFVFI